jgi:inosine-uridine nucleoside N-ribohydrolase
MTAIKSALGGFRPSLWVMTAALFVVCHPAAAKAPNVIFDTDMWSDIDDALALAMLHALENRGEIKLVAVTVNMEEPWCASYVDAVDTFYGRPKIPIGLVRDGKNLEAIRKQFPETIWPVTEYTRLMAERKKSDGTLVYPHRLVDGSKAPEAVALLRRTLAAQADGSVVMIEVGYHTNLARLLDSGADTASPLGGRDLVARKVRLLSVMAGNFGETEAGGKVKPKGTPEFNLMVDVPAAQKVFSEWPTPIVDSGFEIGISMLYPGYSIDHDYSYVAHHPVADTYRTYAEETKSTWPHDHPTYDLTAVLYAARPDRDYFSLSKPGKITVLADGGSRLDEVDGGAHRYLILSDEQKARALEAMIMLASEPPKQGKSPR